MESTKAIHICLGWLEALVHYNYAVPGEGEKSNIINSNIIEVYVVVVI